MSILSTKSTLKALKQAFTNGSVPAESMLYGFFKARFIGPWWLRMGGQPSVHLSGLPFWQGKKFLTATTATNILKKQERLVEALSMTLLPVISKIDGKPGVALHYGKEAPFPWRYVQDELRALDENTILGVTFVNLPIIKHFGFPFLLERAEK
jgi:hypothetical protein